MAYFVIGDVHGCMKPLEALLQYHDPKKERLIQLGDMIDRGPDSLGVLLEMMRRKEEQDAVILKGNHEEMFLTFLDNPLEEGMWYFQSGGRETVNSFFEEEVAYRRTPTYIADYIKSEFADVVQFMRTLPSYYDAKQWVFVHAGVNFAYEDWRNGSDKDFLWIREQFHYGVNKHGVRFVFGHTPTQLLNADRTDDMWVSSCGSKIGIDGGCVFGGQLHGLRISEDKYEPISVQNERGR